MATATAMLESRNGTPVLAGKQLVVIKGAKPDGGRVFPLPRQGVFAIVRNQKSDTRFLDPKISRTHCEIEIHDGRVLLREARTPGSDRSPLVLVNGVPVREHLLVAGDVIR